MRVAIFGCGVRLGVVVVVMGLCFALFYTLSIWVG
jgi:hypothetical protein